MQEFKSDKLDGLWNLVAKDVWGCVMKFLEPWDLANLSITCRRAYNASRTHNIKMALSYPFRIEYKLTIEQFDCLKRLMTDVKMVNAPKKLVIGEVGSGKTWLGVSYMMRKYSRLIALNKVKILVAVPPMLVVQWSDFFSSYTDLNVYSNYKESQFYKNPTLPLVTDYGIFLSSYINSGKIIDSELKDWLNDHDDPDKKVVLIHDEAHNSLFWKDFSECIGFTASESTFKNRKKYTPQRQRIQKSDIESWEIIKLESQQLQQNLKPVEIKIYEPAGLTKYQAAIISKHLSNYVLSHTEFTVISRALIFECMNSTALRVKAGRKTLNFQSFSELPPNGFKNLAMSNPRVRQLIGLALKIRLKGEKLILFDLTQEILVPYWYILKLHGLKPILFSTQYSVRKRLENLEKFKHGDHTVLLGSINMLAEGHNITEANHIAFLRYPKNSDTFKQAIGRCHRYPQKKKVFLHFLNSFPFEALMGLEAYEKTYTSINLASRPDDVLALREYFSDIIPDEIPHHIQLLWSLNWSIVRSPEKVKMKDCDLSSSEILLLKVSPILPIKKMILNLIYNLNKISVIEIVNQDGILISDVLYAIYNFYSKDLTPSEIFELMTYDGYQFKYGNVGKKISTFFQQRDVIIKKRHSILLWHFSHIRHLSNDVYQLEFWN